MFQAPESLDPDDRRIASREVNGRRPWLEPAEQVPYGHVLHAAALLRWSPAAVVARLTAMGRTDIQHPEALPDTVALDDIPLVRDSSAKCRPAWLDVGKPVSLRQILESAGLADRGPADVARRLTALGYRLGGDGRTLPESPDRGDATLISVNPGPYVKWLDWDDEVPASQVLSAAAHLRCSPHTAATRLLAFGLRLPYTPDPGDELLLRSSGEHGARPLYGAQSIGHILAVAQELGRSPADVAARLTELGWAQPVVPDHPEADDLTILSEELDGRAPWLLKNTVVGLQMRHILRAALTTGRSPADIAERLAALGHWLHENAKLPETVDEEDIRLLETVDRSYLDNIHLEHVLRSASLTGRSPADVAARLTALGHRLPDEVDYPEVRASLATS
ncbi:hypothetical protein GCM10023084_25730 [Streptomyces lacrimifluminis]|uniref:wHTH-Hsp90 Na associated domain-containing protein n=1 Tax=Streptomyces lacrimifluminis TaxID=1500077 RepID=A0A917NNG0_9ACTN|nr:hypothetical protein [Streptomyces lacrimifluminis]GGJ13686.1 hypothetical protein GCM10012282_07520 [Streptomyces lacrimifluminis]